MAVVFSTFTAPLKPGDIVTIYRVYCSGNDQNISQCALQFNTKSTQCDLRHSLGLECMGESMRRAIITKGTHFFVSVSNKTISIYNIYYYV